MNTINHVPSKYLDLEYDKMSHKFWGGFATYMGKYKNNKTRLKFPTGKNKYLNKAAMISKVSRTDTSNKDASKSVQGMKKVYS